MVKSFRGGTLSVLDDEVNKFINEHPNSEIINFTAHTCNDTIKKILYIYTIVYEDNNTCLIDKDELNKLKEFKWKYEELCK